MLLSSFALHRPTIQRDGDEENMSVSLPSTVQASVSLPSTVQASTFSFYTTNINKKPCLRLQALALPHRSRHFFSHSSLNYNFNPLRSLIGNKGRSIMKNKRSGGLSAVCYASPLTAVNLQWISTVSSVVLILARGTAVQKSFIVPLFALLAPESIIAWIKGRYGVWSAFLALIVRLFFYIPGELELPFIALLLVILAPYEVMKLRGRQEGAIISLLIAGYLAFQHFSRASLQKAFDQGSIVATLAVICVTLTSVLLLI